MIIGQSVQVREFKADTSEIFHYRCELCEQLFQLLNYVLHPGCVSSLTKFNAEICLLMSRTKTWCNFLGIIFDMIDTEIYTLSCCFKLNELWK